MTLGKTLVQPSNILETRRLRGLTALPMGETPAQIPAVIKTGQTHWKQDIRPRKDQGRLPKLWRARKTSFQASNILIRYVPQTVKTVIPAKAGMTQEMCI